jgi:multicomponent Na+:H+ antiporter subunit D
MLAMAQLVISLGLLYALGSKDNVVRYPAFYPLMLTLGAGLSGALLAGDLFNLFVFAELLVVSGTILTAISDNKQGAEAAYKYFYISLLASIFLLISIGSLYISYGTLNMADLAMRIASDPQQPLLPVAATLLLVFFMVKSAVVPFHFWQPDFHTTAPTPVSSLLSSVVVKLGVYGFLRMTTLLFVEQAGAIQSALVVFGIAGILFGGLSAIGAQDAKRMLAYSTLAQIGFILVAIGWGTPFSLAAAIIYAFNHSLIKSAMLMLAGSVASRAPIKTAAFSVITGVGKAMPSAGVLFLLGGLALAGIPPTNGFISKLSLFQSGIQAEEYAALSILAVASLLTLVYTMRAFQRIWWQAPEEKSAAKPYGDRLLAPALLILLCLGLGIWGEPLLQVAQATAEWMLNPNDYILAVLGA